MPKKTFFNLSEEKIDRIIKGAKTAFSERKYKDVTIDLIVDYARIPKGSFYQYFKNKDDLFKYIFRNIGNDKKKVLLQSIEKSSDNDFSEMILYLINQSKNFETKDEEMIALKDRFLKECPQGVKSDILNEIMPNTMALFEKIIMIYVDKGEFRRDLNIKAATFILTSTILNIDQYEFDSEKDHGEVFKNICDTLKNGLTL